MAPIDTLMKLDEIIRDLNRVQKLLDEARLSCYDSGLFQLQMDREQAQIDSQRETINDVMFAIASTN